MLEMSCFDYAQHDGYVRVAIVLLCCHPSTSLRMTMASLSCFDSAQHDGGGTQDDDFAVMVRLRSP